MRSPVRPPRRSESSEQKIETLFCVKVLQPYNLFGHLNVAALLHLLLQTPQVENCTAASDFSRYTNFQCRISGPKWGQL